MTQVLASDPRPADQAARAGPLQSLATRFPILFVAVAILSLILVQYVWLFVVPSLSDSARNVAAKVSECVLALLLVSGLAWWHRVGFIRWRWRDFLCALPLLFLPALMLVSQLGKVHVSQQIVLFALLAAMTAFAEETVFRGIAIRVLEPRGVVYAVIVSSVIFGLAHFVNLLQGSSLPVTIGQVVFAGLIGVAFAAPFIYTGSIWPIIVFHFIQDFVAFWTTGSLKNTAPSSLSDVVLPILLIIPVTLYGVWLIRRYLANRGPVPAPRLATPLQTGQFSPAQD